MFKLTKKEQICLEALEQTCKKYDMEKDYCIGTPVEQRICISKRENIWEVFVQERGIEFDKVKCIECIDACLEVIKSCSYCIDEFKDASLEFKNILKSKEEQKKLKK